MCFKRLHNFTQHEIKQHHLSIITASYYELVSPNSTPGKQMNVYHNTLGSFHCRNVYIQLHIHDLGFVHNKIYNTVWEAQL